MQATEVAMNGADPPPADRYRDRFVRETARRIAFLMAAAARFSEPARLMEDLRRALCAGRRKAAGR